MTSPAPETRIYLIRHGSVDNPDDIAYGRLPIPLSAKGRQEILDLCKVFETKGIKFDAIYTSPVARARQSAEIIKKRLRVEKLEVSEDLTDIGVGELEGGPMQIVRDANYIEENLREMGFEIETKREIAKRVSEIISDVVKSHQGKAVVLVSHGDVTRLGLWSCEFPDRVPPRNLRDEKYLAVAEAAVLKFGGDQFTSYEFIRRSAPGQIETDNIRRTEAY